MKTKILAGILAVMAAGAAQATLYTYTWSSGFAGGGLVPDGNVAGWSDTRSIIAANANQITDVNVRLNISGGYNGDLYGYLVHSSGFSVLLNRIGRTDSDPFGNSGGGMNVTLDDDTGGDIHMAGYGVVSGTYNPDARTDNPAIVTAGTGNQTAYLNSFDGLDPNGSWTLFLADLSGGDTSTVVSWGLDIEAVPEPITWALIAFGGLLGATKLGNHWRRRKQVS